MTTEVQVTANTTVVVAERQNGRGWESFTVYSDSEDTFVSYHEQHATQAEAEARAARLIAKFGVK